MDKYYSYLSRREKSRQKRIKEFKQEKKELIHKCISDLIFKFESISEVIIFGSFLSDNFNFDSDIDLYIENIPVEEYYNVRRKLKECIKLDVDLYTQTDNNKFIEKIKNRGEVLYERQNKSIDSRY